MTSRPDTKVEKLIDHLFRQEYGRIISYLTSVFGLEKWESMEDIAQETLLDAYRNWSYHGIPDQPKRWLFKVAKNKAINFSKREQKRGSIYEKFVTDHSDEGEDELYLDREIEDSMLRMIFACAAPELSDINKILLVLNTLCGFTRREIANALLMEEEAIKKRLFRAKKEIREKGIKLTVPAGRALKVRLHSVLSCLYLLFNEGYNSSDTDQVIRKDICLEAIRLTKLLINHFQRETRPRALLSLMCFHTARFASRIDDRGAIILIRDQDRSSWDRELIGLGIYHLSEASEGTELSAYHLEAAIAAEHSKAESFENTNWQYIYTLYEKLLEIKPSPVIEMNMAIVMSQLGDIAGAIRQLVSLEARSKQLVRYYLFFATLGEMYYLHDLPDQALAYFEKARSLTRSQQEKDLLSEKIEKIKKA